MPWTLEIAFVLGLIVANGVFAGAEIAIISVRSSRMKELAGRGGSGRALARLRADPERFLATVQIGITVVSATAAAVGGATLAERAVPPLTQLGLSPEMADRIAIAAVVMVVSYLSLVIGELVPKSLALKWPERYALAAARPLRALSRISAPVVWLLTASSNVVLRLFGDRTSFSESRISRDELLHMVDEAGEAGEVHPRASDMASRAIELGTLRVGAMMIPRPALRPIPVGATREQLTELLERSEEERFVVTREGEDVVGYVTAGDVARALARPELGGIAALVRAVAVVPETALALDVLGTLQSRRVPIAIVVDEAGSVDGIVDIDDLAEEVVGTLVAGSSEDAPPFVREEDDSVVLPGATRIHVANRWFHLELPTGARWSTIGGLVLAKLGAMPSPGASVPLDDGTVIEVVETTPRRIQRVRVRRPPSARPRA